VHAGEDRGARVRLLRVREDEESEVAVVELREKKAIPIFKASLRSEKRREYLQEVLPLIASIDKSFKFGRKAVAYPLKVPLETAVPIVLAEYGANTVLYTKNVERVLADEDLRNVVSAIGRAMLSKKPRTRREKGAFLIPLRQFIKLVERIE
jgi:hypothetical protein